MGVRDYLPFFTIFMVPWSFLPLRVAVVGFTLMSLGLLALTVVMAESLLSGGQSQRPRWATYITLALMLPYIYSAAVLGAVGLLLMFLIVAAWFLFERGREWEAGAAIGLAALIKLIPGLLIVFFLLKRRWRVAGAATATCVVLGLGLPWLSLGHKHALAAHQEFNDRAVRGHTAWATITADQPPKIYANNNALPTVLRRLLTNINAAPGSYDGELHVNVADLPRRTVFGVYAAIMTVLIIASVIAALRPPLRRVDSAAQVQALRAQFGVWCCLSLLAAPLLWIHYLPMVYWPLAVIADRAEQTRHATGRLSPWPTAAMLIWLAGAILLASPVARAVGAQLLALATLWLAVLIARTTPSEASSLPMP